jgi:thiol-disulfide isomerase/thioredoxin
VSIIDVEYSLDDMVKLKDKVLVLFYASWCPFSQKFLSIFEKYVQGVKQTCQSVDRFYAPFAFLFFRAMKGCSGWGRSGYEEDSWKD